MIYQILHNAKIVLEQIHFLHKEQCVHVNILLEYKFIIKM